MKKVIKMTESQLKKITEMVISEQGAMDDILNNSPNAPTYGAGTPTADSPKPTYGEPPKTQTTSEYFNVLERNGNKLMPHKFNDPNARDLEWGDTTTMTIWINGRINLWTNTGGFDPQYMGTMKITGNKSFKIIYDMGEVYDSKTNKIYSVGEESEENLYVNCASSLDEIKEGSIKILKYGCKTDAVKELQKLLGMEEKYQTGYFGPITKGKVKEYQTSKNLKSDGIVGSKTYGALTTQSTTPENTNDTTQTTPEPTTQPEQTNEYFNGLNNLDEDEDITMLDNLFTKDESTSNEINEQETQKTNLTVPEQTLLGFLNRFLKGEDGEFQNTPIEQLKKNMLFNSKTIYPMVQKLLEKKRTGVKTYDDKMFNALFLSMDKAINKEQRYEFFKDGKNITNITYNSQY